jgi:hypothetical protein
MYLCGKSAPSDPHALVPGCPSGTVGSGKDVSTRLDLHHQTHTHWCLAVLQVQWVAARMYVARSAPSDLHARLPGCPRGTVGCSMDVSTVQSDPHAQEAAARIYLLARSAPTCTEAWLSFWYSGPQQELFYKKKPAQTYTEVGY